MKLMTNRKVIPNCSADYLMLNLWRWRFNLAQLDEEETESKTSKSWGLLFWIQWATTKAATIWRVQKRIDSANLLWQWGSHNHCMEAWSVHTLRLCSRDQCAWPWLGVLSTKLCTNQCTLPSFCKHCHGINQAWFNCWICTTIVCNGTYSLHSFLWLRQTATIIDDKNMRLNSVVKWYCLY